VESKKQKEMNKQILKYREQTDGAQRGEGRWGE